ncbi:MAG: TolC family protein [Gemmatimonadetes bacterium]|nr:TolC family protein [Gemmatimonadota bacterium]MCY3612529.1 TolC family protein [Gemmatimonadota bacterium]MYA41731.1 TolC family protein [Gemmatimonadota bacterium]MYE94823.1 TolC family protein [Gemmatimonadota bacterium]MYJ10293.1 TolC family protein [Gemmatimonadota bacterium]
MEGFNTHHRPAGWSNRNGTARLARRLAGGAGAVLAFVALSGGTAPAGGQEAHSNPDGPPVLLSEVVRTALERNRDVLDAEYQLAVAGEQVSEAWSEVYPNVNLSTSFTRNVAPQVSFLPAQIFDPSASEGEFIPVQFGADNIWNLSVNAEQTLFDPRLFVGVGAASRFEGLQREAVRGRTQQVVTRVRLAFYDVLLGQEEVRLTENSLLRVRESLRETTAMREAGMTSDYEVLRLEVELANLEPNLRRARNRRDAARRTLAVEMALDPDAELNLAGELARIDLEHFDANSEANRDILAFVGVPGSDGAALRGSVAEDAGDRSDIRQLAITEGLRRTELRIEQVEYLPKVFAFGTYGLAAQQNGPPDFFGTNAQRGSSKQVGLRVTFPIFSGFSRDARIDQRQAALRQAETQTRFATDRAVAELRNLMADVVEARERAVGQELAVAQAQRGYEIASAQYREGLGSQLELTDAEVALRQSEFNYAQAVYDYLATRARLDEAAGRVPLVDVDPRAGNGGAGGR